MSGKCSSIDQIWCRVLGRKVLFQITFGRPGTRVSTKIHCDFTQIHCDFHKNTLWRQWRPLPALGRLRRFQDHSRGRRGDRYWPPHPRQQLFPLHFWMGTVQILYCTVVTKNEVQAPHGATEHEKITPNIPRTKNFDFFIFAKTFE